MLRLLKFSLGVLVVLPLTLLIAPGGANAATWVVPLAAAGHAQAAAGGPPSTPQGPTASCVTLAPKVVITWSSVTGATSYVVLESTASAAGPFTTVVGSTSGTTITTGNLVAGNYWFAVESQLGQFWVSATSSSSAESTILVSLLCVQP